MSGTTAADTMIPPTTITDTDKEDHHLSEGPVGNDTTTAVTAKSDHPADHELPVVGPNSTVTTSLPSKTTTPIPAAAAAPTTTASNTSHYKYDPEKITLRFLFANRDGLTVTVTCNPSDTIGEVKGVLISIWPKDVPNCEDGDDLRLICMGKGFLSPDSRTLQDCQIPVFKTHPTPVNVSVKPNPNQENGTATDKHNKRNATPPSNHNNNTTGTATTHHHNVNNHNNSNNTPNSRAATTSRPIETGQGCCIIS